MAEESNLRKQMLAAVSKSSLLQHIARNSGASDDLRTMLAKARLVDFSAGVFIIQEGESSNSMYFLAAGEVEITRHGQRLCVLNRMGDVFGELGAITGEARTASVRAMNNVTCLVTDPELTKSLSKSGNSTFIHLMRQALSQVLIARLNSTSESLTVAEQRIEKQELALAALQRRNERLQMENENLQAQIKSGMYGTRGQ